MPEIPTSWMAGEPDTYSIESLIALDNSALNELAAELRGIACHLCEMGHRLSRDGKLHLPSQAKGMIEVQPCKMAQFKPATDRNQSREILDWFVETQWKAGYTIRYGKLFRSVSIAAATSGDDVKVSVNGTGAKSETIAFCAAMLAINGRLK